MTQKPQKKAPPKNGRAFLIYGAPEGIRTPDRSVRSRVLYPAELQARILLSANYLLLANSRQRIILKKQQLFVN